MAAVAVAAVAAAGLAAMAVPAAVAMVVLVWSVATEEPAARAVPVVPVALAPFSPRVVVGALASSYIESVGQQEDSPEQATEIVHEALQPQDPAASFPSPSAQPVEAQGHIVPSALADIVDVVGGTRREGDYISQATSIVSEALQTLDPAAFSQAPAAQQVEAQGHIALSAAVAPSAALRHPSPSTIRIADSPGHPRCTSLDHPPTP